MLFATYYGINFFLAGFASLTFYPMDGLVITTNIRKKNYGPIGHMLTYMTKLAAALLVGWTRSNGQYRGK
jgi:Zn-dependent protease